MQVGTSSLSPITRGTDYAFISIHHREPAYCLVRRFATLLGMLSFVTVSEASPRRDQSLQGHAAEAAEDFPRHCPPVTCDRVGFRRYERVCTWSRLHAGQFDLPDKEFRLSCYL